MYQICISGGSKGKSVEEGKDLALAAGRAIAQSGCTLLSGATIGLPNYSAEAYKKAGGRMSLGLSPAGSKVEHVLKYRLPTHAYDAILYTGLHYVGRDTLLISSADAIVSIGGRIGTLHEFTIAMEMDKPIGFLQGAGGVSVEIMDILHAAGESRAKNVIFSDDADDLVRQIVTLLNATNKKYLDLYKS
jgi:uncharacterized protein (TIGR00725 family)